MKKINLKLIILNILIFSAVACNAQVPLNTSLSNIPNNGYVKDINNELDQYIGVYKANSQGNEIILYITKEENKPVVLMNKNFYRDVLVINYIVKNSSGNILRDTQNLTNPNIEFYSMRTNPAKNIVYFNYSGICTVGNGFVNLSKISNTQIKWNYEPQEYYIKDCPTGTDTTNYLPREDNLIFTKQ